MSIERIPGKGWLALLGGGEFSFGDTEVADEAWLAKAEPGAVGFVPAASGSTEYGGHFATYLGEAFERQVETVPIFRGRDARRGKNVERLTAFGAVYIGGGVADQLLAALQGSPCAEALGLKLENGGVVAMVAAAAQSAGEWVRPLRGGEPLPGLGWLPGGVVETNFEPAHDRRLRQLMKSPGVHWGLGIPAGSAVLLGPDGVLEHIGLCFTLRDAEGDLTILGDASPT